MFKVRHIRFVFIIALLSWVMGMHQANAQDTRLVLANNMTATHHVVEGQAKAAVLLIHGWAGHMDEVGDLYKRLAAELGKQGIASLRINIRGEGEHNDGQIILSSTFASRVEDAKTGLAFLKRSYPSLAVGVVGFSLGGATSLVVAGQQPNDIKSMVLWSSAGNPIETSKHLLTSGQQADVLNKGYVVLDSWAKIKVTKQHYLGFKDIDVFTPLKAYKGALLCIRGTQDSIPDIDAQIMSAASGSPMEYRHIAGADHIFNVLDANSDYDERVLSQTLDWFLKTL